jgi:hypothetical protein
MKRIALITTLAVTTALALASFASAAPTPAWARGSNHSAPQWLHGAAVRPSWYHNGAVRPSWYRNGAVRAVIRRSESAA